MPKTRYSPKDKMECEREYVTCQANLVQLAEKYQINYNTLRDLAWKEGWNQRRREWKSKHVSAPAPGTLPVLTVDSLSPPSLPDAPHLETPPLPASVQVSIGPEFLLQVNTAYTLELQHLLEMVKDARTEYYNCPPGKEKAVMADTYCTLMDQMRIMQGIPAPAPAPRKQQPEIRVKAEPMSVLPEE